jgi:hypothetical protein
MSRRGTLVFFFTVLTLASASSVRAQGYPAGAPSAYRFYVAPGARSFLMVDGPTVGHELVPSVGLMLDYAHRPFALDDYDCLTSPDVSCTGRELDVVAGMAVTQLSGAIALADVVQIGVNVPIVLRVWGDGHRWTFDGRPYSFAGGSDSMVGDPRLHAKVQLFEQDLGGDVRLSAGVAAWMTFPIAHLSVPTADPLRYRGYAGEPTIAGGAHVILGVAWQRLRAAINLGAAIREEAQLITSRRTSEMTWGAALAYDFTPIFGAMAELSGQTTFGLVFDDEAPTELRVAPYLRVDDFVLTAGVGIGIGYAIGVPVLRALAGIAWEPRQHADFDADGRRDDVDACPSDAEDLDGVDDEDGCPDVDDDGDRIADHVDRCRGEPEDADGHEDGDGCPDPDNDGDGVADGYDSCPDDAEDPDGDRDTDGCPDDDRDRDRIPDARDACPDEIEDTDGLGDEDGCPETDFDHDGIPDDADQCPEEPEDRDGVEDRDGCPEARGRAAGVVGFATSFRRA